jgi:hypothetical protein
MTAGRYEGAAAEKAAPFPNVVRWSSILCQPYNGWSRAELRRSKTQFKTNWFNLEGPDLKEDKMPTPRRWHNPKPDRRRALELLASCPDGCTETIMLVHGFTVGQLDELIRAGLATAQTESVVARSRALEVARVRITKAGRMILTGR